METKQGKSEYIWRSKWWLCLLASCDMFKRGRNLKAKRLTNSASSLSKCRQKWMKGDRCEQFEWSPVYRGFTFLSYCATWRLESRNFLGGKFWVMFLSDPQFSKANAEATLMEKYLSFIALPPLRVVFAPLWSNGKTAFEKYVRFANRHLSCFTTGGRRVSWVVTDCTLCNGSQMRVHQSDFHIAQLLQSPQIRLVRGCKKFIYSPS